MTSKFQAMIPALCLLLILLGLAVPCRTAGAAEEPPLLVVRVLHSQSAYAPGGTYPLALELTIRQGYHINSDRPKEADVYPSRAKLTGAQDVTVGPVVFPQPKSYKPSFSSQPMEVFDGRILLRSTLTVAKGAKPGPRQLNASLDFQGCDDQACLMPETLEVAIPAGVGPGGQALNQEVFRK